MSPSELLIADFRERFETQAVAPAFARIYSDDDFGHAFAVLHERLNRHFDAINGRAASTHHYWAEDSRELLALIQQVRQDLHDLKRAGITVELHHRYENAIERCEPWLVQSGGSTVPADFEPIDILRYEPVFTRPADTVRLQKQRHDLPLTMVGEGSYARVYSYTDPDYGIKYALKRAKQGISERDLARFKTEFDVMSRLSFPYIVAVYRYNDERSEYRMEFCDETLRTYIRRRNSSLAFASRKRIALQFLYGINYIHSENLLHRDISLQNVLLKVFDKGAVLVKLSDFGLVKDQDSTFTRTGTEMRGTIRDPLLDDFKEYALANEMYAVGFVLSYIFTGRESLRSTGDEVSRIVQKCASHDASERYANVPELISDVERLDAMPIDAPA